MVTFTTILKKFDAKGEKTGWTYIEIPAEEAEELNPGVKTSYRVKGKLDDYKISQVALIPMGDGTFIIPFNATMRKALGKRKGYSVNVTITLDKSEFNFSEDFIACLEDEPKALAHFKTLTGSHQKYFSKWIDSAKTIPTKSKRITMAIKALSLKQGYPEMIRANKKVD